MHVCCRVIASISCIKLEESPQKIEYPFNEDEVSSVSLSFLIKEFYQQVVYWTSVGHFVCLFEFRLYLLSSTSIIHENEKKER